MIEASTMNYSDVDYPAADWNKNLSLNHNRNRGINEMDLQRYWEVTLAQDADAMHAFFHRDAYVNWHNTNEHFTAEEFIQANCEYPGEWDGKLERIEQIDSLFITVTHVYSADRELSFHVTSFIRMRDDRIASIDEYWGDDGSAPQWRLNKHIGTPIQ